VECRQLSQRGRIQRSLVSGRRDRQRDVMIKAVDTSGNESPSPGWIDIITPPPEMNSSTTSIVSQDLQYRLSNFELVTRMISIGVCPASVVFKDGYVSGGSTGAGLTWRRKGRRRIELNGQTKTTAFSK